MTVVYADFQWFRVFSINMPKQKKGVTIFDVNFCV